MKPTSFLGLLGLVVAGLMLGDILTHPAGTQAAGNALVSIITPTESSLLGVAPK